MDRFLTVGKAAPRTEGPEKVAGKATYAADKTFPRIVWGKAVRSGFPHARIVSIDTSKAKAHPGVLAVITAQDVPDVLTGRQLQDTPILALDRVRFIGEKVAVVGAESREIAEEAAALIDIEYEEWPAVFDPMDAMRQSAPLLHQEMASYGNLPKPMAGIPNVHSHVQWLVGDCERGFAESDLVFEQTFATQRAHQGYLEPHASVVYIERPGGRLVFEQSSFPDQKVSCPGHRRRREKNYRGTEFGGRRLRWQGRADGPSVMLFPGQSYGTARENDHDLC